MAKHKHRWTLKLFLAVLIFCSCKPSPPNKENDQPNIVLILADDLGWSDLGSYGGEILTPNLDQLAANGIRYTQFNNTSKCFPSRASLLTGLYAHQVGFAKTHTNPIKNAITLGELLKSAGYRTLWSGKHHGIENPLSRGFDRYFGLVDGASNHFNPGLQREGEPAPAQKKPDRTWYVDSTLHRPYTPKKGFYTTDAFTDQALDWIDGYKDGASPFFLYLAYTAPHDPLMAWPQDIAKYRGKYKGGYEAIRKERIRKQMEIGLLNDSSVISNPTFEAWNSLSQEEQEKEDLRMAVYAAMIDRMDQNIGRVMQKLKELEKLDNTLIIFMSDNGSSSEVVKIGGNGEIGTVGHWESLGKNWANVSNTPFKFYKNYSYQGGIGTPLIVSWPKGIEQTNTINSSVGHFIDVLPTLMDVAGASYPKEYNGKHVVPFEGVSFSPTFSGMTIKRDKPLYWKWSDGKALRKEDWKIVSEGTDAPWELYNLVNDPNETKNLAHENQKVVKQLDSLYRIWQSTHDNY
ncbi:arylsulfatase [Flagellimonas pacifica]|uniref:Arylsulfatase n=1 Tax=Flagellimonas pacifica TaxID=1247520 RepID=A0A285MF22_9FLAO|nr:arylsulfatase [Allomuricauda parva]SNY95067.1 arylsulfatase [Allomuricauda parva]